LPKADTEATEVVTGIWDGEAMDIISAGVEATDNITVGAIGPGTMAGGGVIDIIIVGVTGTIIIATGDHNRKRPPELAAFLR
jgi:hypothetical protein